MSKLKSTEGRYTNMITAQGKRVTFLQIRLEVMDQRNRRMELQEQAEVFILRNSKTLFEVFEC